MEYLPLAIAPLVIVLLIWLKRKHRPDGWLRKKPGAPIGWQVVRGKMLQGEMRDWYLIGGPYPTKHTAEAEAVELRWQARYTNVPIEVHPVFAEKEQGE